MIKEECPHSNKLVSSDRHLLGMDHSATPIVGIVEVALTIGGIPLKTPLTCAVIGDDSFVGCCLLGANFLAHSGAVVDYYKNELKIGQTRIAFPLDNKNSRSNDTTSPSLLRLISLEEEEQDHKVRYRAVENIEQLQDRDYAVKLLKTKLIKGVPAGQWERPCLKKFRRYEAEFQLKGGVLVKHCGNREVAVVPFSLLVEVVYKTHMEVAHIGRHKLMDLVTQHFWHPSLDEVARDVCGSCNHCQLYKISSQHIAPPIIKIQSAHPFDLLAMDLIQFAKSTKGHIAALVTVDHFSKFMYAVPLRDKRSQTVCNALLKILPTMVRLPSRILTDNGPEFRSNELEQLLQMYNIQHVKSTRYRAQGNGAVERCNRTITEFLKGIQDNEKDWDIKLPQAVIAYNNTFHTETKESPNNMLFSKAYSIPPEMLVGASVVDTWKEGHPQFAPFRRQQKVALKIQKIGNQLKYKLGKKFTGPYYVIKVQSNNVTYEIRDCNSEGNATIKAHHRQIKAWKDPPAYLQKYVDSFVKQDGNRDYCSESQNEVPEERVSVAMDCSFMSPDSDASDESSDSSNSESSSSGADSSCDTDSPPEVSQRGMQSSGSSSEENNTCGRT